MVDGGFVKRNKKMSFLLVSSVSLIASPLISYNTNATINKSSKIVFEGFEGFEVQSVKEFEQFDNKNEKSKLPFMLILNENMSNDELSDMMEKIRNFDSIIKISRSKVLDNHLMGSLKNDKTKLKKIFEFFENNQYISNVYINYSSNLIVESTPNDDVKFESYKSYDGYLNNFISNNYTKEFRDEIIDKFKDYMWYDNKRIGIGVLEVGDETKWWNHNALINEKDEFYFDISKDTKQIIVNDQSTFYVPPFWNIKPQYGIHSTQVASIIAGKNGVNPLLKLYGVKLNTLNNDDVYKSLDDEISYLTRQKDVKVINNSWGEKNPSNKLYKYNSYSRYFDEVAKKFPEIIFVFSAGNNGGEENEQKRKLNAEKLSYNSIMVGSNNSIGSVSGFSSYNSDTGKSVLLLANGTNYKFKDGYESGTSYAAPFISGVLGNTLVKYEDKYDYGKNNIIAMATLAASTSNERNYNSHSQSKLNPRVGAGILDYSKLDQAFNNLKYIKWLKDKSKVNNTPNKNTDKKEVSINNITIEKGKTIRISLAWEFDGKTFYNSDKTKPNVKDFDLYLYDENEKLLASSKDERHNIEFIKFKTTETGNYKIKIYDSSYDPYNEQEWELALTWTIG